MAQRPVLRPFIIQLLELAQLSNKSDDSAPTSKEGFLHHKSGVFSILLVKPQHR
jgi:hypothetical protein